MNAINEWRGDANAGTSLIEVAVEAAVSGLLYELRAANEPLVRYRAVDNDTRETIAAALANRMSSWGSWTVDHIPGQEVFTLTSTRAGVPLWRTTQAGNPRSSFIERVQAGVRPVPQVIEVTLPATTTGGTWDLTFDFGGGNETAEDLSATITPAALVTAIEALATPEGGDVSATLVSSSPRTYRITLGGSLATGVNATVSADGSSLTGNASATVSRVQSIGGSPPEVWFVRWSHTAFSTPTLSVTIDGSDHTATPADIVNQDWWEARLPASTDNFVGQTVQHSSADQASTTAALALPSSVSVSVSGGTGTVFSEATRLQDYLGETNHDFQWLAVASGGSLGADYTLTFDGQETATIAAQSNASSIRLALENLSNIGSGDVHVIGGYLSANGGSEIAPVLIRFQGDLGNADQPALVVTQVGGGEAPTITTLSDGSGPVNDIHAVTLQAEGGTWTGRVPIGEPLYDPTAGIDYAETAANVKTAIEATLDEGETVDTAGGGVPGNPYLIEYTGDLAATTIPLIEIDTSSLTGGKPIEWETVTDAAPGTNEIQRINVDPNAVDGTLRAGFGGAFTAAIDHDAADAAWESELEDLTTIGSENVSVSGGFPAYLVEFVGDLKWEPQPLLTLDQDSLETSGETALSLTIQAFGSGPEDYANPGNWSLGHVPNTGETIVYGSGRQHCRYGLLQRGTFDVKIPDGASDTIKLHTSDLDLLDNQIVRLRTTGTFPDAEDESEQSITIDAETDYHVVGIDYIGRTLLLAEEPNGDPIHWTSAGTGTHTIEVRPASIQVYGRYSGELGLPRRRERGEFESLPRYLTIGLLDPEGTEDNLVIGQGDGPASNRLMLDVEGEVRGLILNTGSAQDIPALLLLLDHPETEIHVVSGEVGIALESDEQSTLGRLNSYGGRTVLGRVKVSRIGNFNRGVEFMRGLADSDLIQTST